MNPIADDILFYYDDGDELMHEGVSVLDGAPGRGSGRYQLGSGENPNQRRGDFLSRIDKLKKAGFTETQIAKALGYTQTDKYGREHTSTTAYRVDYKIAQHEFRAAEAATAARLRNEGYSLKTIAEKMGYANDSSIRTLLNEATAERKGKAVKVAAFLKEQVDSKGFLDVGEGAELEIDCGISKGVLEESLELLKRDGYPIYNRRFEQVTNRGKFTTLSILCPPGTEYQDVYKDAEGNTPKINSIRDYISRDGSETFDPKWVYPASMDSKRLQIRYTEEGGVDQDGLIELRRGVKDLSLGNAHYAQVRILVDGTHYIKGMAAYADDLPEGVDVRFNTNKKLGTPMKDVLKPVKRDKDGKPDPTNPFGSLIKEGIEDPDKPESKGGGQSYYIGDDGKKHLSLINKRADEGDWGEWSKELPSQFLAKQPIKLIEQQLAMSKADRQREFETIISLQNPTVKKVLLQSFSDDCDTAAETLKAAPLPRQRYQVILPLKSISDNEVYAPNFRDGEYVALIRFPHSGPHEIPVLKVNNKLPEGIRMMSSSPKDAIGISKNVADRLSGADFDGDTTLVIPLSRAARALYSRDQLPGLKNADGTAFDPKEAYPYIEGMRMMKYEKVGKDGKTTLVDNTQIEMGKISNLITDMYLRGATDEELARATRHSMVVIDAGKHKLNYIQSAKDNRIEELKADYQGYPDEEGNPHGGASTLISRAAAEKQVNKRRGTPYINQKGKPWYDPTKEEGAYIYKEAFDLEYEVRKKVRKKDPDTGKYLKDEKGNYIYETEVNPTTGQERFVYEGTGKTKTRTEKSTQMRETDDAYSLVSTARTKQELAYADYANFCKSLANRARKEMVTTGKISKSTSAAKAYETEVQHLMAQLIVAKKNAPRERQAQVLATTIVEAKKQANPDMSKSEIKKVSQQALTEARNRVGAKRHQVEISEKEWEAIQAGAISETVLKDVLTHADIDKIRELAMPKASLMLSESKVNLIKTMRDSGYTTDEIAQRLKISTSTVTNYI